MRELYETPKMEIVEFDVEDVITTSDTSYNNNDIELPPHNFQ